MDKETDYRSKVVSAEYILDLIKPGNKIFLSSGPTIPTRFVTEMVESEKLNLQDLELIQLITLGKHLSTSPFKGRKYRLKTFNIGESISKQINEGEVDFIPANLVEIPYIFSEGAVNVDIAVIQTSPPNKRGFLSLGIANDVANIVLNYAPMVVAEINPNMPVTHGETLIHIDQVNHIIESNSPLIERERKPYNDVMDRIGWHIANLIEDGSTVTLYVGRIFDAIASHLHEKRNLGIFTNVISDWVIELIESGAISMKRARYKGGQVNTSYCYGTRALYDYVDQNPVIEFHPIALLSNPFIIKRVSRLVSIMNVKKIDVSGESVIFHSGDNLLTGYESKLNFAVGAAFSRQGKAIVALTSLDQEGNSNIVLSHNEDTDRVRATLGVTRYVVTEYGVANLFGKSIRERVLSMVDIAHPKHRKALLEEAKKQGYAYPDQIYVTENAVNYPMDLETVKTFRGNLEVKFRPIKPSDEDNMRRLFYDFSDESKYLRYFVRIQVMPHRDMQKYLNIDYNETLSIVGTVQRGRAEKIIAEGRYAFFEREQSYETAFLVDEEYQGRGIASFLINYLIMIAKQRGLKKLSASVLPENDKMLRVFRGADVEPKITYVDGAMEVLFNLDEEKKSEGN